MPFFEKFAFDSTAFMSGQIISKDWLCDVLEPLLIDHPSIWLLGGWYAMTNFLLTSRKAPIGKVTSFDIDPEATKGALILNETSVYRGVFDAQTADVNTLSYASPPNIVINTSTEHMESDLWFKIIPSGTMVMLQSNDMPHDDHVFNMNTVDDLLEAFPFSQVLFKGEKKITYETWGFTRFMTVGVK